MADPRLLSTGPIPLADIDRSSRMRPVSDKAVAALVSSITVLGGIKDEIHVRKIKKSGKLVLIAGGHRCAAGHALGWTEIPAKVWECTDAQAAMLEIDDNLAHAELSPLDLVWFLREKKRVYLKMHPETARGAAGASARWDATDIMSFASSVAEQRGLSERHVRRLIEAGEALDHADFNRLRRVPSQITLKDIQDLAKVTDIQARYNATERVRLGQAKKIAQALATPKPASDPDEAALAKLMTAWDRAPMAVRRRFLDARGGQIALMADGGADV